MVEYFDYTPFISFDKDLYASTHFALREHFYRQKSILRNFAKFSIFNFQ